jgi:hypothetical protein
MKGIKEHFLNPKMNGQLFEKHGKTFNLREIF